MKISQFKQLIREVITEADPQPPKFDSEAYDELIKYSKGIADVASKLKAMHDPLYAGKYTRPQHPLDYPTSAIDVLVQWSDNVKKMLPRVLKDARTTLCK